MMDIAKKISTVLRKIHYIFKLIITTPYFGWIIFTQILSGIFSFIGLPVLIPILEFMQNKNYPGDETSTLKIIITPMKAMGFEPTFHSLLLVAGALILFGQVLVVVSSLIARYAREDLLSYYRKKLFAGYAKVDWLWLTEKHSGSMYYTVMGEATTAVEAHLNAQRLFINFFQMMIYLIIALRLSFIIVCLAVVVYSIIGIVSVLNSNIINRAARKYNERMKSLSKNMIGLQQNKKFFKGSSLSDRLTRPISKIIDDINRLYKKQMTHLEGQRGWTIMSTSMFLILLIFFHQQLSLNYATLLLTLFIFYKLAPEFAAVSAMYASLSTCIPMHQSLQRHLIDLNQHQEKSGEKVFSFDKPIIFAKVSFSYPNGREVLKEIDLEILPRKTIAFVGGSGVGKTTILDLLLGLLSPKNGMIYYGQIPHTELDKNSLRSQVAYVSQQPSLLDGTLKENLTIGCPEASDDMIEDICQKAHIDQFIKSLPEGINTLIGENGIKLSGGQKQRVVLGRSLFLAPKILILDEATSELDMESESMIQATINNLKKELTIIIVAHRLSTVKLADMLYVIEDGKVCESGNYEELILKKGRLYFLDSLQK